MARRFSEDLVIRLENWAIINPSNDPYTAPELRLVRLEGVVYGHPKHKDGSCVKTSYVVHADGREVYTKNSKYVLGKVSKSYQNWHIKQFSKPIDEESPFS